MTTPTDLALSRLDMDAYLAALHEFVAGGLARPGRQQTIAEARGDLVRADRGYCFTASYLTSRILQRRGGRAYPLFVMCAFWNRIGKEALFEITQRGERMPTAEISAERWPGIYGVGTDDSSDTSYHAIVVLPDMSEGPTLLDLTASQYARPQHGIHLERVMRGPWLPEEKRGAIDLEDGGVAVYWQRRKQLEVTPERILASPRAIERFVRRWSESSNL